MRWIDHEEDRIKAEGLESLKCVVLDMGGKFFLYSWTEIIHISEL
mgnify:CR=1 FL=1|jgi:hypothetical protein